MQDEILGYVKDYYSDMECNAEFDLYGFSEDELSRTCTITLSEFGHALGIFVSKRLGALIPKTMNSQKEIGFGLLAKTLNNKNKEKNLYEINEDGKYDEVIAGSIYPDKDSFDDVADYLDKHEYDAINKLIVLRGKRLQIRSFTT